MTSPVSVSESGLNALKESGFDFFTGVADSVIAGLIDRLERDPAGYVPAVREDLAVGLASGAWLAGRRPAVLMQNSGLGYCLNALTSLNLVYRIPLLLIVGYRGFPGRPDAPEHDVMGAHCEPLLKQIGIPVRVPGSDDLPEAIRESSDFLRRQGTPAAVLIRPGLLERGEAG